jgi:hypothetical protein
MLVSLQYPLNNGRNLRLEVEDAINNPRNLVITSTFLMNEAYFRLPDGVNLLGKHEGSDQSD